jgi:hypothetical protein
LDFFGRGVGTNEVEHIHWLLEDRSNRNVKLATRNPYNGNVEECVES